MIAGFPTLYPDELLYSLFARYYAQSGHMAYVFAAEELFENRTIKPDIEFMDKLTPEVIRLIMRENRWRRLLSSTLCSRITVAFLHSKEGNRLW